MAAYLISLEMRCSDDTHTCVVFFLTVPSHSSKWWATHSDNDAAVWITAGELSALANGGSFRACAAYQARGHSIGPVRIRYTYRCPVTVFRCPLTSQVLGCRGLWPVGRAAGLRQRN